MELIDIGTKSGGCEVTAKPEAKNKVYYPSLRMEKIPGELKSKDVGHICRLEIVAKIVSKSEDDHGESITLEIQKVGYASKAGKKSFDEYEKMNKEEKDKYDQESTEDSGEENEDEQGE